MDEVIAVVDSKKPGDEVDSRVLRGSKSRVVKVELGNRPARVGTSSGSDPQGGPLELAALIPGANARGAAVPSPRSPH